MKEIISQLTWADYIALVVVLRGLYSGYKAGIFQELLRLAAYIISVVATLLLFEHVAQYLTLHTFLNEGSAKAAAFASVLAVVYLLLVLARTVIVKSLKVGEGGKAQKIAGAVFGAGRLLVLLSFFFMLVDMTPFVSELKKDVHERSYSGQKISMVAPQILDFLSRYTPNAGFLKAGT